MNQLETDQPTTKPERASKERTPAVSTKPERIRAELNIEKWPALWNPTHSKTRSKDIRPRTLEREVLSEDGTRTVSKVTINPIAHLGDLTTEDQRTLYALIKHWEDRGKPDHETPFSIRQLSRLLNKRGWGSNVIDSVTGSLERLRGTMLVWTRSYKSKDQRVEDQETVYINILTKLKIVRRKVDGHITTEAGYFQFDDNILKNLLTNYTKPLLFDVFIDIKGEIALKLYSYLDLILADKTRFERCTKDLFEDLGLRGVSYRNPSKRKQNLEKAFAELSGITLTTGVLKSATIERTKDGKDYKAIFVKGSRTLLPDDEPRTRFVTQSEPVVINNYSARKDAMTLQAEELLAEFYRRFHNVDRYYPQSKETAKAVTLIAQHGFTAAKHIVDFAHRAAQESNYRPATFGGILHYTSRALAELEKQHRLDAGNTGEPERPRKPVDSVPTTRPAADPKPSFAVGERRLAALTEEQRAARYEIAKNALFKERPFLATTWKLGSTLHDRAIRARMVQDLEAEPMDLAVIYPNLVAIAPWYFRPTQNSGL